MLVLNKPSKWWINDCEYMKIIYIWELRLKKRMKAILVVMNTSWVVVKIRPEKVVHSHRFQSFSRLLLLEWLDRMINIFQNPTTVVWFSLLPLFYFRGHWHGEVAVKMIEIENPTEEQLNAFKFQVGTFRKTRHENVVLFMGACMDPPKLAIITR